MAQQPPQYAQQRSSSQQSGAQSHRQVVGQQASQPVGSQQLGGHSQQAGQQGQQGAGQWLEQNLTSEMRETLEECRRITEICDWVVDQTIKEAPERTELIRICRDCADMAALNARLITRESRFSPGLTEMVREACTECATACEQYGEEYNLESASECRRCADSCARLLQTMQA